MKTNELIRELKIRTQSSKDRLKNVKYLINIMIGKVEPSCSYGCAFAVSIPKRYNMVWHTKRKELVDQKLCLEEEIKTIGKTILFLRGNKWSI